MRMVIAENCRFIPRRNVDDRHTDRYNYKKPKSTNAVFYYQNLQFVEKIIKKDAISGDTVMFLSFWTDRSRQTVQTQITLRGAIWSGSTLFAIQSASFGLITLW